MRSLVLLEFVFLQRGREQRHRRKGLGRRKSTSLFGKLGRIDVGNVDISGPWNAIDTWIQRKSEFLNCHMENGWEVGKIFDVTDKKT